MGLLEYPLYISEEYSSKKPEDNRFRQIMDDFDASNFVYVADNPEKDFLGPNQLGWKTIGVRNSGSNIHEQNIKGLGETHLPNVWVDQLTEIVDCLC